MPKLHRGRGASHEPIPAPGDPVDPDDVALVVVEAVVVDEHGDDAAAVGGFVDPSVALIVGEHGPDLVVPPRRRRRS